MPSLHRRSSCSTLDSFSIPRDANGGSSIIGDNGDLTNSTIDALANPFQFTPCNATWTASHLESGGGWIPPRPVSAPSLTTTAVARDDGSNRSSGRDSSSHLNSYIITPAPFDDTVTSGSNPTEPGYSGFPGLAMPPTSLPILAVSAIPNLPGITSATDPRAVPSASMWSNNIWSAGTSAGLTPMPLGYNYMDLDDGILELKQNAFVGVTHSSHHMQAQQTHAPLADLKHLGIGIGSTMDDLQFGTDQNQGIWKVPFNGTMCNQSGLPFSDPGSTYSSSLPSSSGVASPESFSAPTTLCDLPVLRSNPVNMSTDDQQSHGYRLPGPFLAIDTDSLDDLFDYTGASSTEEKSGGLSVATAKTEGEVAYVMCPSQTRPNDRTGVAHLITPARKSKDDGICRTHTSDLQGLSATQPFRGRPQGVTATSPVVSGRDKQSSSEPGTRTSIGGAAIRRRTTSTDGFARQEYSSHSASNYIIDSPAPASNPFAHDAPTQLLRTSPSQSHLAQSPSRRHLRLSPTTPQKYLPYTIGQHRPMTSVSTSERRSFFTPTRSASDQQVVLPSGIVKGTPLIGAHRRKSPSEPKAATLAALDTVRERSSPLQSPVHQHNLIQPTPQRRAHFNMIDLGLDLVPRTGEAGEYTATTGQTSQAQLQQVPLLRRHAPPSPPFRPIYGQLATSPSSTDKARPGAALKTETKTETGGLLSGNLGSLDGQAGTGPVSLLDLGNHGQTSNYPRGVKRAQIACTPCRQTKRKCDGGQPCSACVRRKFPRGGPCEYIPPAPRSRPSKDGSQRKAIMAEQKRLKEEGAMMAAEGMPAEMTSSIETMAESAVASMAGPSPVVTELTPSSLRPSAVKKNSNGATSQRTPSAKGKSTKRSTVTATTASQYPTLSALLDSSRFTTAPMSSAADGGMCSEVLSSSSALLPSTTSHVPKTLTYATGTTTGLATTGAVRTIGSTPGAGLLSSSSAGSTMGQCR